MAALPICMIMIEPGPCRFSRLPDQPFLIGVVQQEEPGAVTGMALPDNIIEMILVPAFLTRLFPFTMCIYFAGAYPKKRLIRKGGDRGFPRRLLHLPLPDDELNIIPPLGIASQQQE